MKIIVLILFSLYISLHKNLVFGLNVTSEDFGTLIGSTTKSAWTGQTIFQFLGVRYAQSPSGSRRFKVCGLSNYNLKFMLFCFFVCFVKKPVLAIPWPGNHDVRSHGRPCPCLRDIQRMNSNELNGDIEDCLHMSIFTKNVSVSSHSLF